jgi:hypothetical protein
MPFRPKGGIFIRMESGEDGRISRLKMEINLIMDILQYRLF